MRRKMANTGRWTTLLPALVTALLIAKRWPGAAREARVLGLAPGATLAAAGPLRGFFLVDAADLAAATAFARTNPHLAAGGVIEVRPVGP